MRRILLPLALLVLASLLLALGQQGTYFSPEELKLIEAAGKEYHQVLAGMDEGQRLCSQYKNRLPADLLPSFIEKQRALIQYPKDGKLMGDWKKGGAIFNNLARANCFSCHFGSPIHWGGDVGPSLEKYGQRGTSEAIQRYTYEVIYNAWAYFPCSVMYRFGANKVLTPEEIADVVAYLLDPASDFNTKPAATGR